MKKSIISFLLISVFITPPAEARRDRVRETRQQGRIAEGVKSGELTALEARKLHRGQKRVDAAQRKALADGELSAKENLKLEKMQDHQSRQIYKEKHDNQQQGE